MRVRPPAVAGSFYPADPALLCGRVDRLLAEAKRPGLLRPPQGPHRAARGLRLFGPDRRTAYARLAALRGRIRRVVLLGPAHRVALRGLALPSADAFATPLGLVALDRDALERAAALPQVRGPTPRTQTSTASRSSCPSCSPCSATSRWSLRRRRRTRDEVAELLERLWGGAETLVVISSDLSHYHDYADARELDAATARAIEALDGGALDGEQACGRLPIRGLLRAARRHGLAVETVDLRNSGDTAGARDRVVGYGAWAFTAGRAAGLATP